jgi:hypothetical protein
MRKARFAVLTGATLGLLVGMTGAATAAPTKGFPVTLHCDGGLTFYTVIMGNGEFTPAHDLNSTSILIPTAFGPLVGTFTDADGLVTPVNDPPTTKGAGANQTRSTTVSCSYHVEFTDAEGTFSADGTVTGFVTPVR